MSTETLNLTPALYTYLQAVSLREAPVLAKLRETTHTMPGAMMQISPEQGQFMALLVELMGAKKTLDIGTYTGYSALSVALALPADGKVIALDIIAESTAVAKTFWAEAGVAKKIDLHLAPAAETLARLIAEGEAGTFDFAFIDADKRNYAIYYEQSLTLLRQGGLIAIDNVLWGGRVVDALDDDKDTTAIRLLNEIVHQDERVSISLIPIGDGLTLARKR
ncbi:MAG: SAM-dependent methyltransferase [Gammaproteobacteria bacterium RIFCSPHIGHO2_12_FULL_43_28]|nr:MAG: SAM-dependent methyltransferase [Gammaproteobacteria bacterium RIFCSPHIGHO2_12_FULL_43_28]